MSEAGGQSAAGTHRQHGDASTPKLSSGVTALQDEDEVQETERRPCAARERAGELETETLVTAFAAGKPRLVSFDEIVDEVKIRLQRQGLSPPTSRYCHSCRDKASRLGLPLAI